MVLNNICNLYEGVLVTIFAYPISLPRASQADFQIVLLHDSASARYTWRYAVYVFKHIFTPGLLIVVVARILTCKFVCVLNNYEYLVSTIGFHA